MADTHEFERRRKFLIDSIERRMLAVKPSKAALARARTSEEAIGKQNVTSYVKFWLLADALETTPNLLCGLPEGFAEDVVSGLIDAVVAALDLRTAEEQAVLSRALLRVLCSRDIRNSHMPPRDTVRILVHSLIGQAQRGEL